MWCAAALRLVAAGLDEISRTLDEALAHLRLGQVVPCLSRMANGAYLEYYGGKAADDPVARETRPI
jgi:hypothetical protein